MSSSINLCSRSLTTMNNIEKSLEDSDEDSVNIFSIEDYVIN